MSPRGGVRPGSGRKSLGEQRDETVRMTMKVEQELLDVVDAARLRLDGGIDRSEYLRAALVRATGDDRALRFVEPLGASTVALALRLPASLKARVETQAAGTGHGAFTRALRGAALDLAAALGVAS